MSEQDKFRKIISHSKEYGFIYPSSEIYDGLGAVYDYGPNGSELKNNLRRYWWDAMVRLHENIVGIDAAIFMHPDVWKASGHVDAFNDPLIDNKDSKKRYRADQLIEEYLQKLDGKAEKEVAKARKKFGDNFDEKLFRETNPRLTGILEKKKKIYDRYVAALENDDLQELKQIILDCEIADPVSGTRNWTDVRQFNLMFETKLGSVSDDSSTLYLRPETAQGIFVNFLNVQKTSRMKIPFGIAQTGKAFRNEIVARQFVFRMREFEQMEMQYFVKPGTEMEWFQTWKAFRMKWHESILGNQNHLRFHDHEKLAHYANAAADIEFEFPMGFREVEGIHSRTDFDLSRHQEFSGRKLQFYDVETKESFIPYVVETSIGLDRMFLAVLSNGYMEEKAPNAEGVLEDRVVLKIHPALAPVKVAVLPLVKKDGLPDVARKILNNLKFDFNCHYDEKDSIGRRYRRHDAIGTPYCVTVDHQTTVDETVTLRDRDTMEQIRVKIQKRPQILNEKVSMKSLLKSLV